MKKFTLLLFFFPLLLSAQFTEVNLDFESVYIGENNALPAETNLLFSGAIPDYIDRVEIHLLRPDSKRAPLHTATWQRPLGNTEAVYKLPVNYKLRSSSSYDIEALFFRAIDEDDREALIDNWASRLMLYLDSHRKPGKRGVDWEEKPSRLLRGMNALLEKDLSNYRAGLPGQQQQLSELIALQAEKMAKMRLPADSTAAAARLAEEDALLERLVADELARIIPTRLYELADARYLENAPTEEKRGAVAVNAGYGGVHLGGDFSKELQYDTAPFVGLSFPLGNSAFAPRFFSNTYFGFGLFLSKFEDAEGRELSGPITDLPLYASLEYKLFQFIYLNAGATLLERGNPDATSTLLVRPFVGLSAKVNLSLSFDR